MYGPSVAMMTISTKKPNPSQQAGVCPGKTVAPQQISPNQRQEPPEQTGDHGTLVRRRVRKNPLAQLDNLEA